MSGSMSRSKGQRGEREFAQLLTEWAEPVVQSVEGARSLEMKRNLVQSRQGGHDLVGLDWLAIEVKRQENLSIPAWWRQAVQQAERVPGSIPFLAYRQNRTPWRFRVMVQSLHCGKWSQPLAVDMDEATTKKWFQVELYYRLVEPSP